MGTARNESEVYTVITIPENLDPRECMIFVAEATECGAKTDEERQCCASHALELERARRAEACKNLARKHAGTYANRARPNLAPGLRPYRQVPTNAAEMRDACIQAAHARYETSGDLHAEGNHCVRWWSIVALANAPAGEGIYCVRGVIGAKRAALILGLDVRNASSYESRHDKRDKVGYQAALTFGAKLEAVWS
jgi:hypothetical protein